MLELTGMELLSVSTAAVLDCGLFDRSRVSRSSLISNLSKLGLGRRSGDHELDPEEVFDLMSAEEKEHMSNSGMASPSLSSSSLESSPHSLSP